MFSVLSLLRPLTPRGSNCEEKSASLNARFLQFCATTLDLRIHCTHLLEAFVVCTAGVKVMPTSGNQAGARGDGSGADNSKKCFAAAAASLTALYKESCGAYDQGVRDARDEIRRYVLCAIAAQRRRHELDHAIALGSDRSQDISHMAAPSSSSRRAELVGLIDGEELLGFIDRPVPRPDRMRHHSSVSASSPSSTAAATDYATFRQRRSRSPSGFTDGGSVPSQQRSSAHLVERSFWNGFSMEDDSISSFEFGPRPAHPRRRIA